MKNGVSLAFARSTILGSVLALASCSDDAGSTPPANDAATDSATDVSAVDASADSGADSGPVRVKLPCNVSVGTGSGKLAIDGTIGKTGDVICIKAGSYGGGSIKGVSDRILQNDGGLVTITDVVEVANLTNVVFSGAGDDALTYGFRLSGTKASFVITGPNRGLDVHDFEAIGAGIFLDAGHTGLMWNGQPSELVLYQSHLHRMYLKQSNELFQGNYGALSTYLNFASDIEMDHIVVEDSKGQGQTVVNGGGIFDLDVHDWTITGKNDVALGSLDDRDTGVIMIFGSGRFSRMHRDGGWGWLVRTFGVQLGAQPGEFRCENNVDLNTEYYGTCEVRNTDSPTYLVPGKLSTVGIFVSNNVSAHKLDLKKGYTTAIALIPNLMAGTTATLTNNVGCENADDYGDKESLHFFTVDGTVVKSGNLQLTSCAGRTDPITGKPL